MMRGRALATIALVVAGSAAPSRAETPSIERVRDFEISLEDDAVNSDLAGDMLVSPTTRRGYIFFPRKDVTTLIRVIQIDTLDVLGEREVAGHPWSTVGALQVDTVRRRLVIPWRNFGPGEGGGRDLDDFLVLDEDAMLSGNPFEARIPVPLPFPRTHTLEGITITQESSPRLVTTMQQASPFAVGNYSYPRANLLISYDLDTGTQLHEPYIVQACGRAPIVAGPTVKARPMDTLLADNGDLFVVCQSAPLTGQVVRLRMKDRVPTGDEAAFPGPNWVGESIADQAGQRLVLKSNVGNGGISFWVFDAGRLSFTGEIGLTPTAPPRCGEWTGPVQRPRLCDGR